MQKPPETCRAFYRWNKLCMLVSCWTFIDMSKWTRRKGVWRSEGIAACILKLGNRPIWVVSFTLSSLLPTGKTFVTLWIWNSVASEGVLALWRRGNSIVWAGNRTQTWWSSNPPEYALIKSLCGPVITKTTERLQKTRPPVRRCVTLVMTGPGRREIR